MKVVSDMINKMREEGYDDESIKIIFSNVIKHYDRAILESNIYNCNMCKLNVEKVSGYGPSSASLMIIGECPGPKEIELDEPFVGDSGQLLRSAIEEFDLDINKIYLTNAVKCYHKPGVYPATNVIINCAKNFIKHEINIVKPLVILSLGNTPSSLFGVTEILSNHGKVVDYNGITVVCSVHPSYIVRIKNKDKAKYKEIYEMFLEDINVALDELYHKIEETGDTERSPFKDTDIFDS